MPSEKEALYVIAVGCSSSRTSIHWDSADLRVQNHETPEYERGSCRLYDDAAGLEVRCDKVTLIRAPAADLFLLSEV